MPGMLSRLIPAGQSAPQVQWDETDFRTEQRRPVRPTDDRAGGPRPARVIRHPGRAARDRRSL